MIRRHLRLNICGTECQDIKAMREHPDLYDKPSIEGGDWFKETSPVDAFPAGRNDWGVGNLLGNVTQWTSTWWGSLKGVPHVLCRRGAVRHHHAAHGGRRTHLRFGRRARAARRVSMCPPLKTCPKCYSPSQTFARRPRRAASTPASFSPLPLVGSFAKRASPFPPHRASLVRRARSLGGSPRISGHVLSFKGSIMHRGSNGCHPPTALWGHRAPPTNSQPHAQRHVVVCVPLGDADKACQKLHLVARGQDRPPEGRAAKAGGKVRRRGAAIAADSARGTLPKEGIRIDSHLG